MTVSIQTNPDLRLNTQASPRILIVRLSAVGDVVHALPALNALRAAMPQAHIGWAVHPGASNLLEGHSQIDELIIVPRQVFGWKGLAGLSGLRKLLRGSSGWDWAVDFQGLTKSGVAAWLSGAPRRVGFAGNASRELNTLFMTDRIAPQSPGVISMNMELLKPIGISKHAAKAVLSYTADDMEIVESWARKYGIINERFLVIDPFAGWQSKLWEQANWIDMTREAGKKFGLRVLVIHGPGEVMKAEQIAQRIRAAGTDAMVAPSTTLRQLAALLREHAACVVAGDTGPMHMAAALGVPTVALFGPSDSRRNAPAFDGAMFVALQDFSQPCAGSFARHCRYHPPGKCMASLSPDQVIDALESLISAAATNIP
ncbi:MAG: glycosyltransferase family 9 protein [bacterium]